MSSFIKQNLKLSKQSIQESNFEEAVFYADKVLESDEKNYNALLLIGKAQDELNEPQKSFDAYTRATKVQPENPSAWKGLLLLHEGQKDLLKYIDAFVGLIKCYEAADDIHGAGDALIKAQKLKKDNEAQKKFLHLQLPGSPIYEFLESRFPKIYQTFNKLISIYEKEENEVINKAVSKQRFKIQQDFNTNAMKYKIYKNSQLPALYNGLINTTMDDEERRMTEGKLLRYIYNLLRVAPANEKAPMRKDAAEMSSGLVVVRTSEPLAWKLDIDWSDPVELKDLEFDTISYYCKNFGEPGARVLQAFLHSSISPFTSDEKVVNNKEKGKEDEEEGDDESENQEEWTAVGVLEVMSDGFDNDSEFILAYRIMGQLYLQSQEYESASDVAKKGLEMIKKLSQETLTDYYNAKNHLLVILGTAYTYYQAPKNFDKAVQMFDIVLQNESKNINAMIGKGLIFIEKNKLEEAEKLLQTVHDEHPDNYQALYELSWCRILQNKDGRDGLKKCLSIITGTDPESMNYRAKILWRIGNSYWKEGEKTEAFNSFVRSLQHNPNYAPAYTSLGDFYSSLDKVRATKCYYKAFELDSGEIEAAYALATEFADNSEWSLVEIVASRVIESERLRTFSNKEAAWPYRALGIVGLNKRDYAQAVQYFQSSLRLAPRDANAWIGLGEAYTNSGRYIAAAKAFERALVYDSDSWVAEYQLGIVNREVMQYEDAIESFKKVLENGYNEMSVKIALIDTYLRAAWYNLVNEFFSQAVDQAVECILAAKKAIGEGINTQMIWKTVGDACEIFLLVESQEDKVPLTELTNMLEIGCHEQERGLQEGSTVRETLIKFTITSFELSLGSCRKDVSSRAMGYYNLGVVLLKASTKWGQDTLNESVEHLKKAIELEHRNFDFWNAYGIASSSINPRVAQHCFIRSLSFNIAQPKVWANLGALYLIHGDVELAEEAFEKTQAIDPECVNAWLGQGIIESVKGQRDNADATFNQSFLISKGSDSLAKLVYGLSVLERAQSGSSLIKGYNHEVETGVLALQKYLMLSPKNDYGLTIQGMLLERESDFEYALKHIENHCQVLEEQYEKSESEQDLEKFCKAKTHLARLYLGNGDYEQAIEHAEFSDSLSATLTSGLGYYFLEKLDESIGCFKRALEMSDEDQDVVVLLAQVLWAQGGQEEKEVALDQLYNSVGTKGASLRITLLLGAIGLVDDSDLIEAAREELEGLTIEDLKKDYDDNRVQEILSLITQSKGPWQRAAFMWPSNFKVWQQIDKKVALKLASGNENIAAVELSDAWLSEKSIDSAQRAVFYAPWNVNAWTALS